MPQATSKQRIAATLVSMAFGEGARFAMIQAVAMFFTTKCMREIQGPNVDIFTPAKGHTASPTLKADLVEEIIQVAAVNFDKSPDALTNTRDGVSELPGGFRPGLTTWRYDAGGDECRSKWPASVRAWKAPSTARDLQSLQLYVRNPPIGG